MIRKVGQLSFIDKDFAGEMITCLEEKGFLLETIYADRLVVGYRIYQRECRFENVTHDIITAE